MWHRERIHSVSDMFYMGEKVWEYQNLKFHEALKWFGEFQFYVTDSYAHFVCKS